MLKFPFLSLLILFIIPALVWAQLPDTGSLKKDTLQNVPVDTMIRSVDSVPPTSITDTILPKKDTSLQGILNENRFLNSKSDGVVLPVKPRNAKGNEFYFYLLAFLVMLLGFFKVFFARYFTNLFRVFFNTSLRQSQLTDQLLQAKLPSLLFNLFFVISGGLYIYFLLLYYNWIPTQNSWLMIGSCMAVLGAIYVVKYCTLKFTGWVTGFKDATNSYVFIIFLINKIIGILLVPLIILMAFSTPAVAHSAVLVSLLSIGFLLILRFFRSYGLLQNQLKVSRFHFFLYILGIELVPLLLIYKGLMLLLSKNP